MTLIKSISGIRGTIGGTPGEALTPIDVVKFTAAFATFVTRGSQKRKIVVGRDARISGEMVRNLVVGTLQGLGVDVVDLGLSTTPTVEMAVPAEGAAGGIILTASHNPGQWNALKLLNHKGEFINDEEGLEVLRIGDLQEFSFAEVQSLGTITHREDYIKKHIDAILKLDLVDVDVIRNAKFSIAVDAVNSTGGIAVPQLLEALGVTEVYPIYCNPNGHFPHNPEPLAENLRDLSALVSEKHADMGIAVDPDVDRLCFVMENGEMFGEEYTLVAVADYILGEKIGNTVSNLSSTRALKDVTERHGGGYAAAAVGEVNVVTKMKETDAVIGGEGNGGVIYPALHYGRDALVGIALFLTYLAKKRMKVTELRASYPAYFMAKNKITLTPSLDINELMRRLESVYKDMPHTTIDGLKIDYPDGWIHLRKSNTEPIIRIYTEGKTIQDATALSEEVMRQIETIVNS